MNNKQIEFLKSKTYLLKAFEEITEEDKNFMKTLDEKAVNKEQVKKLQEIAKRMTKHMTIKEKICFWNDLITLIKLNEQ